MHRSTTLALFAWLALIAGATGRLEAQQTNEPRKVALLVGVNKYERRNFDDLAYAERDVEDVGAELKKLGFNVVVLKGSSAGELRATREQIDKQLGRLLDGIGKRDLVFVMFSGHGQQFTVAKPDGGTKEDAFFCPVDAVKDDPKRLFSVSYLIDDVLANRGGRNVVLIDACRDEPKDASRGAKGVQGRSIALPEETAVFFSCRAGQRSYESDQAGGGHGLFTYCLLDGIRKATPGTALTWSTLVAHVENMMDSEEIAKLIPQGRQQDPLPAGNIGRLMLARMLAPVAAGPLAKLPEGPPGKPLRWFSTNVHDPLVLGTAAKTMNVILDRSWQDSGDALVRAARKQGVSVIVALNRKEYAAFETKLFDFVRQNRDIVAGVALLNPYTAKGGLTPDQVGDFGRRLKQAFPGISYWVAYIEMPAEMSEPLPAVPPEVDVIEVSYYFCMTPESLETKVDNYMADWMKRAGDRPVVLEWVSKPSPRWTPHSGRLRTEPGTMRKCVELALKHKAAGVGFGQIGARRDNFSPGIETDPTAIAELRDMAAQYGFAAAPQAADKGWKSLFNGKDLAGWTPKYSDGEWTVNDGVLTATAGRAGLGGWLATNDVFTDFELQLEYKLPEAGNSGAFLRIPTENEGPPSGGQFLEVQLLDDAADKYRNMREWQRSGSIYGIAARSDLPAAPADQWNRLSITYVGAHVTVRINDTVVVRRDLQTLVAEKPPNFRRESGGIGLQRHDTRVEFRNIRIRNIEPAVP